MKVSRKSEKIKNYNSVKSYKSKKSKKSKKSYKSYKSKKKYYSSERKKSEKKTISHGINKLISFADNIKTQHNAFADKIKKQQDDLRFYGKSVGIISMNVEGESFPKTIDDKIKARFDSFQNLDVIVVGFQEEKKKSGSVKFMESLLLNHILVVEEYMAGIGKVGFRGTRILVFVHYTKTSLKSSIKTINLCDNSSCLLGLPCCNKGLNAVNFFDEFVIINSHLVLGVHKLLFKEAVDKRVCMMSSLFNRLKKEFKWNDIKDKKIIWFGDLNFRVSPQIQTKEQFMKIIEENLELNNKNLELNNKNLEANLKDSFNIDSYIQNDELKKLLEGNYTKETLKCVFPLDLYEEKITFNPSCKLKKGTENIYNVINGGKMRLPSWCDRILYNQNLKNQYDVKYESFKFPIKTDHNGVFAIFTPNNDFFNESHQK
jgi:hypothetical protein